MRLDIAAEQFAHRAVVALRQVAGDRVDLDFGAHRHGAGPQAAVDLHVGVDDRLASEPPRTKVSIVTSAGTTLTASPPLVMIGWMRIVSWSWKRLALAVDRVERDLRRATAR